MSNVVISEKAIRELVKEVFNSDWSGSSDEAPVNVSDVVDPSSAITDPGNPNYVPNNKVELQVAIKSLSDDLADDDVPGFYEKFISAIEKDKDDKDMKKNDIKVENFIRLKVRKMLQEAMPIRMPGVLGDDEELASAEEVKAWVPGVGMPAPKGYEVVTGKRGKETIQVKAKMPAGMKPTKVAPGVSGVADKRLAKYKTGLQSQLGKMKDLDFPDEQVSEDNLKDWLGTIVSVNDAMKYKEAYIEAHKQNNEEQNEYADWNMTTESPAFEKKFKQAFGGSTFRTYCLPVGRKIKERLTSAKNYSAADIGAEGIADELAAEFGVSRSQLKNIEDQTLAKFALGMLAEMPTEEEAMAGLGDIPVAESKIVESYIQILSRAGRLSKNDARILKENPEMVVDLPGFKRYLITRFSL